MCKIVFKLEDLGLKCFEQAEIIQMSKMSHFGRVCRCSIVFLLVLFFR